MAASTPCSTFTSFQSPWRSKKGDGAARANASLAGIQQCVPARGPQCLLLRVHCIFSSKWAHTESNPLGEIQRQTTGGPRRACSRLLGVSREMRSTGRRADRQRRSPRNSQAALPITNKTPKQPLSRHTQSSNNNFLQDLSGITLAFGEVSSACPHPLPELVHPEADNPDNFEVPLPVEWSQALRAGSEDLQRTASVQALLSPEVGQARDGVAPCPTVPHPLGATYRATRSPVAAPSGSLLA